MVKKKINSGGTKLVVTLDSRESEGYLVIEDVLLSDWISEVPLSVAPQAEQAKGSFKAIDITRQCNGNYEEVVHRLLHRPGEEQISDALTGLGPGKMLLAGIPFTIPSGRNNLIMAGPEPGANQGDHRKLWIEDQARSCGTGQPGCYGDGQDRRPCKRNLLPRCR